MMNALKKTTFVFFSFFFYGNLLAVKIQYLEPQTLSQQELVAHKQLAAKTFFDYDTSINYAGPLESYFDYFENFFIAFKKQESAEFLLGAYDENDQLVGGLFGKELKNPPPALRVNVNQKAYYLDCLYVAGNLQGKGIATRLVQFLLMDSSKTPLFLYVWAINTAARKVYEKSGFILITDEQHPDGKGTAAAYALQTNDGYNPNDFVVYRKN